MHPRPPAGGYIALMATIIISMVLLVMVAQEGFAGWHARFNVLGTEMKEEANTLAEGCADQALASLITNPQFAGDATDTLPSGSCYISPIVPSGSGQVLIQAQSQVGSALAGGLIYSNLALVMTLANIYIGAAQSNATQGTVVVQTIVQTGSASPSQFLMSLSAGGVPIKSFAGSSQGVASEITPGIYSVSQAPSGGGGGYTYTYSSGCSGSVAAGEIKTCTFTESAVQTTLTLVANVTNKYNGTLPPTSFPLLIDGQPAALGVAYVMTPGTHIASTIIPSGYLASDWGPSTEGGDSSYCPAGGTINLQTGDNKICVINFADIPPPNPSCADTVMMLDRTGSMSAPELSDEQTAADDIENLYSLVTINTPALPPPLIGVGSAGGLDGSNASVPNGTPSGIYGILTTVYSTIVSAIAKMTASNSSVGTHLDSAINAANAELQSARHALGNQKVLILITDGDFGSTAGASGSATSTPVAVGDFDTWGGGGDAAKVSALASGSNSASISEGPSAQTFVFAGAGVPGSATINSVTLSATASGSGSIALMEESGTGSSQQALATTTINLASSWKSYSWSPASSASGAAWTAALVNNWTNDFGVFKSSATGTAQVSNLSLAVNYSTPAASSALAPTAVGNYSGWTVNTGTGSSAKPNAVATNDGNTTYISYTNSSSSAYQTFVFPNAGIPSNAQNISVAVTAVAEYSSGSSGKISIRAENGTKSSNTDDGSSYALSNSYAAITRTMSTNPVTGDTWAASGSTSDNVNNFANSSGMRFGVVENSGSLRVTQMYVVVNYTLAGSTVTLAPAAIGDFNSWSGSNKIAAVSDTDNTSYISQAPDIQTFAFGGGAIPSGASISSVTVNATAEEIGGNATLQFFAENGTSTSQQLAGTTTQNLTSSWKNYSWNVPSAPGGAAWTASALASGATDFGFWKNTPGATAAVSAASLVVSYTTSPTQAALSAADAAKTAPDGKGATTTVFTIYYSATASTTLENFVANLATGTTTVLGHQPGSYNPTGGVSSGTVSATPAAVIAPNQWTTPSNALPGGSTKNYATNKTKSQQQGYTNFSFTGANEVPPTSSIAGIEVDFHAMASSGSASCSVTAELSQDGGATWTASGTKTSTISKSNTDTSEALGGSTSLWGSSWASTSFDPPNFAVRLQNNCSSGSTISVNRLSVKVSYSVNTVNDDGGDFFIAPTSADMPGIFDFIGNQVCPAARPSAIVSPTAANLLIMEQIAGGTASSSAFTLTVSPAGQSPTVFSSINLDPPGASVSINPGTYSVTEAPLAGYTETPSPGCSADSTDPIAAGESRVCIFSNAPLPPPPPLTISTGSWTEVPTSGQ